MKARHGAFWLQYMLLYVSLLVHFVSLSFCEEQGTPCRHVPYPKQYSFTHHLIVVHRVNA